MSDATTAYKRRLRKKRLEFAALSDFQKRLSRDVLVRICYFVSEPFTLEQFKEIDDLSVEKCLTKIRVHQEICDVNYVTKDDNSATILVAKRDWQLRMTYSLPALPTHKNHSTLFNMARTCKSMYRAVKYYRSLAVPKLVGIEKLITIKTHEELRARKRHYIQNQFSEAKPQLIKHLKKSWNLDTVRLIVQRDKDAVFKPLAAFKPWPTESKYEYEPETNNVKWYPPNMARKDWFSFRFEFCRIDKHLKFDKYTVEDLMSYKNFSKFDESYTSVMSHFKMLLFNTLKLPSWAGIGFLVYYQTIDDEIVFIFAPRIHNL